MTVSRRNLLAAAGTGALSGMIVPLASGKAKAAPTTGSKVCFVMPDIVDGPYYESRAIMRSDITEGKKGIPLEVRVCIVDPSCRPIAGARVDCWQADAGGIYSNYPNQGDDLTVATMGETFLRGTQITDKDGWVTFLTIYPGWYRARTAHLHFKVYVGDRTRLTTQMFFPDALNEFIYLNVPEYQRQAVRDTVNVTDWILVEASRHAMANVREEIDRYVAEATFGVDPRAMPAASEPMPCPAEGKCVPEPNIPPDPSDRVAALIPSAANARRPKAQKPALPR